MDRWERVLVGPDASIHDALEAVDSGGVGIAIVVDENRRLLGTLSDGDLRRALLKGVPMESQASQIMAKEPTVMRDGAVSDEILSLMRRTGLRQIPVVDSAGCVVRLEVVEDYFLPAQHDNWVVLMAGGLGSRLKELTRTVPKPMLSVGGRPMLETILRTYVDQGFRRFYIAVNYRAEAIESHFGDGSEFGAEIRYLREDEPLGTAGALALLPELPSEPVLVANGDVLAKVSHEDMLRVHTARDAAATMAVREYEYQVPFGVVSEEQGVINSIEEKPVHRFMVCAGLYVLSPDALRFISRGERSDMPTVFEALIAAGKKTCCHPIRSYWLDVGRIDDYQRAELDYHEIFS